MTGRGINYKIVEDPKDPDREIVLIFQNGFLLGALSGTDLYTLHDMEPVKVDRTNCDCPLTVVEIILTRPPADHLTADYLLDGLRDRDR